MAASLPLLAKLQSRLTTNLRLSETSIDDRATRGRVDYNAFMNQTLKDAVSAQVPLEVYLRSSGYEPDAEYVDGKIEERPMGEFDHAAWQLAIIKWFLRHEEEWNIDVLPELRVQAAPTRFRVPDVTVLDRSLPVEQIITHPPIAVFEVLSPEDTFSRLKRKLEDYRTMGIPHIWIIDPEDGSFSRFEDSQLNRREFFSDPARGINFDMNVIKGLLTRTSRS
jgi:Uma2 family endonuclease